MLVTKINKKNLGNIKQSESVTAIFTVTNDSEEEITLDFIHKSCESCTKVEIEKETFEPFESVPVVITITPKSTGNTIKHVSLYYKEGKYIKLTVSGVVIP